MVYAAIFQKNNASQVEYNFCYWRIMRIFLIKAILYLCAYLPLPLIHALGVGIGYGLILVPNRSRYTTAINIALCLPELTATEQHRLARRSLIETGKTIIETSALWMRSGKRTLRLIREVDGQELVEQAMAAGNGVILATPHLGAWECAGLYCAARFNITCLYRPLKMPELEGLVVNARSRMGGNYVPATARGIRILYKTLEQGQPVAMLPDQEPQAGTGIFAPFFGVPAYSMTLLVRLAAKAATPVVFVWCERLSWGRGYRLHFRSAPEATRSGNIDEAVAATNLAVENCVRECPTQYQWSYRRFRKRPAGGASFYNTKASASAARIRG
jgi:KDO2-lipid IV(A) lauroyltransferase